MEEGADTGTDGTRGKGATQTAGRDTRLKWSQLIFLEILGNPHYGTNNLWGIDYPRSRFQ